MSGGGGGHRPMPVCTFFGKTAGCKNGDRCRFQHIKQTSWQEIKDSYLHTAGGCGGVYHITWPCASPQPTLDDEREMVSFLVQSEGERDQGVYKDLPTSRQEEIREQGCVRRPFSIQGVCSLRRQLIREQFKGDSTAFYATTSSSTSTSTAATAAVAANVGDATAVAQAGSGGVVSSEGSMGSQEAAKAHAQLFEHAIRKFLVEQQQQQQQHLGGMAFDFLTEQELIDKGLTNNTPDFVFVSPTRVFINGQEVNWLDAKTYYGSSLLCTNERVPIGKLRLQAERYTREFGQGGFVFLSGFSADLSARARFGGQGDEEENDDYEAGGGGGGGGAGGGGGGGVDGDMSGKKRKEREGEGGGGLCVLLLDATPLAMGVVDLPSLIDEATI